MESIEGNFLANHGGDEVDMGRRLQQLTAEPDSFRVLVLLNERSASVSEIAARLGLDASAVGGYLSKLREEGFVEVAGEALHSGAFEPTFRALVRTLWTDDEWAALSVAERKELIVWTIEWLYAELREAIDEGTFTARTDSHVSRTVSLLDEQGWRELTRIQREALDATFAVQAASAERRAERGEEGFPVLSTMVCCELPPRGEASG